MVRWCFFLVSFLRDTTGVFDVGADVEGPGALAGGCGCGGDNSEVGSSTCASSKKSVSYKCSRDNLTNSS